MLRSTRRRFIVALALLSHLMAALFVHVPMAYASTMPPAETETSAPCPDHLNLNHESAATSAADSSHSMPNHGASDHASGCKSGPCKCPCAHAQVTAIPALGIPVLAHTESLSHYRLPLAPECETSFFRPPIA